MDVEQITGLILAGGRGTRMGSVDKGLQTFRGAPMALHVLMRLQPQVGHLMINANRNLGPYEAFGVEVWPDEIAGYAGPLAGLHAGLSHCGTEWLVTAPCDSPFLPLDLVARLAEGIESADADCALAVTEENGERQAHPVFCMVATRLLPELDVFLREGGRKIDAWTAGLRTVEVLFAQPEAFRNVNTREDLQRFEPE